ncbi:MAG TPA: AIPR family protein [Phycisphaerae bacterium]|nr:AIPR family protein [Phycisphaerae bacterium]
MVQATIKSEYSRRMPDPVFKGVDRHILLCRAAHLPDGIPLDPNPRAQKTDHWLYKQVKSSLLNDEDGSPENSFHLKNKGITIICDSIEQLDDKGTFKLTFDSGGGKKQGIVDGGHTYKVIREAIDDGENGCPPEQFVRIEVLQGIHPDWITYIAGGLNTSVQVQEMSLANLAGKFDWIGDALSGCAFVDRIAYRENEKNSASRPYDARDVVSWMTLFNVDLYPNEGAALPIKAYTSKEATLNEYLSKTSTYKKLVPILPDILRLHDHVQLAVIESHNVAGGHAGKLAFVSHRKRGEHSLVFIGKNAKKKLYDGALYPMLGAFRWMVTHDKRSGTFKWRGGNFTCVLEILRKVASQMMASTKDVSDKTGRNPNAIGKNRSHWENLYRTVAMEQMRTEMSER